MFLDEFEKEINGLFSQNNSAFTLKTDVVEYNDKYDLYCNIPGASKEQVRVEIDNELLTIFVSLPPVEFSEDKFRMPVRERATGDMKRQFRMTDVDATKITANLNNGVLHLVLPKIQKTAQTAVQII